MFGMIEASITLAVLAAEQQEDAMFREYVATLPQGEQCKAIAARAEAKEKARREAIEERRHRELVDAVRYSHRYGMSAALDLMPRLDAQQANSPSAMEILGMDGLYGAASGDY